MIRQTLLAGLLSILTACGELAKDPATGLTFRAPASWTSVPGFMGVHIFASPNADQFILLRSLEPSETSDTVLRGYDIRNPRQIVRRSIIVCSRNAANETKAVIYFLKLSQATRNRSEMQRQLSARCVPRNLIPVGKARR